MSKVLTVDDILNDFDEFDDIINSDGIDLNIEDILSLDVEDIYDIGNVMGTDVSNKALQKTLSESNLPSASDFRKSSIPPEFNLIPMNTIEASVYHTTSKLGNQNLESGHVQFYDETSSYSAPSVYQLPNSIGDELEIDYDQIYLHTNDKSIFPMDKLSSLDIADRREQRFLSMGNADVIPILCKSNSSDSYSSLSFDTKSTISSQLKRNHNNKHHGPGSATIIHANSKYVAIGTSRGCILIFDHSQEIRQILSSVPHSQPADPGKSASIMSNFSIMSSKPNQNIQSDKQQSHDATSAILTLDSSPNGSFLLSGDQLGNVILWDVLKGTIVQKISDIHVSRILKAQFCRRLCSSSTFSYIKSSQTNYQSSGSGSIVPANSLHESLSQKSLSSLASTTASDKRFDNQSVSQNYHGSREDDDIIDNLVSVSVDAHGICHRLKFSKQMWSVSFESDCLLDGKLGVIEEFKVSKPLDDFPLRMQSLLSSQLSKIHVTIPCDWILAAFASSNKTYIVQVYPIVRLLYRWNPNNDGRAIISTSTCLDWGWSVKAGDHQDSKTEAVLVLIRGAGHLVESLQVTCDHGSPDTQLIFTPLHNMAIDEPVVDIRYLSDSQIFVSSMVRMYVLTPNLEVIERISFPNATPLIPPIDNQLTFNPSDLSDTTSTLNIFSASTQSVYVLYKDQTVIECCSSHWVSMFSGFERQGRWLECLGVIRDNFVNLTDAIGAHDASLFLVFHLKKYLRLTIAPTYKSTVMADLKHYSLVANVCVELCISLSKDDLLFGNIYDVFCGTGLQLVYFSALEPYILSRKIKHLPPRVFADLLISSQESNRISFLERVIAFLDVDGVDMNLLSKFLLERKLFTTFLYAFGYGSLDLAGAFKIIFHRLVCETADVGTVGFDWIPSTMQVDVGYRILLFLKYITEDLIYPRHESYTISADQIFPLALFITSKQYNPPEILRSDQLHFSAEYLVLSLLTIVDSYATMFYICKLVDRLQQDHESISTFQTSISCFYQNLFEFYHRISLSSHVYDSLLSTFLSVILHQADRCLGELPINLLIGLIECSSSRSDCNVEIENSMMRIFKIQLKHLNDSSQMKEMEKSLLRTGYYRVLVILAEINGVNALRYAFDGLNYYIKLLIQHQELGGTPSTTHLFEFIELVRSRLANNDVEKLSLILVEQIDQLSIINLEMTKQLCNGHLARYYSQISFRIQSRPLQQFELCHSMMHHIRNCSSMKIADICNQADVMNYIRMLVKWKPTEIVSFINSDDLFIASDPDSTNMLGESSSDATSNNGKSSDCFPIDAAIALFKEVGLLDVAAMLTEKTGNLADALQILVVNLKQHLQRVRVMVDYIFASDTKKLSDDEISLKQLFRGALTSKQNEFRISLSKFEGYNQLVRDVIMISSLCTRIDIKFNNFEIWFKTFDLIISERKNYGQIGVSATKTVLISILSSLIQLFISEMKERVTSHEIIQRVTQMYSGSKYVEFKDIIVSMIRSQSFEHRTMSCALLIHTNDYFNLLQTKYSRKRRGYLISAEDREIAPKSVRSVFNKSQPILPSDKKKGFEKQSLGFASELLVLKIPTSSSDICIEDRKPGTLPIHPKFQSFYECD